MTPYHLAPRRTRPIFEYSPEGTPVEVVLRRFPVTRWTAWAATGAIYHLWTHEKLGWWVRSDALIGPMGMPTWRPIVAPLVLPVADGEPLTLTFSDWPPRPADHATHPFWHEAGPIVRLVANVQKGWPGDPPIGTLLLGPDQ